MLIPSDGLFADAMILAGTLNRVLTVVCVAVFGVEVTLALIALILIVYVARFHLTKND